MNDIRSRDVSNVFVVRHAGGTSERVEDVVAVEEPLEIQLGFSEQGRRTFRPLSITMRTPGADFELSAGFLFSEGVIHSAEDIAEVRYCGPATQKLSGSNVVRVELAETVSVDLTRLSRNFYTTSSCGVCGKSSIEALQTVRTSPVEPLTIPVASTVLNRLPGILQSQQGLFRATGGNHAAGLFDHAGKLLVVHEDVGRHNAVDKVVGDQLLKRNLPLRDVLLMVSGRASFELVQKAVVAGIPLLASVGAPSSLAIELASQFGLALVGFVRGDRLNVYTGLDQINLVT